MTTEQCVRATARRDWPDLQWTAVLEPEDEYGHVVARFNLFKHEATTMEDAPLFWRAGSSGNSDPTADPDDAECAATLSVKWDGCGNLNTEGALHICEREHLEHFSTALLRCYDWARELGMDRL